MCGAGASQREAEMARSGEWTQEQRDARSALVRALVLLNAPREHDTSVLVEVAERLEDVAIWLRVRAFEAMDEPADVAKS